MNPEELEAVALLVLARLGGSVGSRGREGRQGLPGEPGVRGERGPRGERRLAQLSPSVKDPHRHTERFYDGIGQAFRADWFPSQEW